MTTLIAAILLAAVPAAGKGFWLGAAAVASLSASGTDYYHEQGRPADTLTVISKDSYVGAALLAGYAPTEWVRFQATLLELRRTRTGCVDLALAPGVGLDVQFEPPVRWRVRPYLWAGGTWNLRLVTALPPKTLALQPEMTLNAGPGATVLVAPRLSAFFETGLVGASRQSGFDPLLGAVWTETTSYIAVERPKLGIRWYFQ